MFAPAQLRIRCYVDDPLIAASGPAPEACVSIGVLLLAWSSFGVPLAWTKASFGRSVTWIGAELTSVMVDGLPGVKATLAQKKFEEMCALVETLLKTKGMVDIAKVKRLAGQVSWASGLFPWLKCFNRHLWASIVDHELPTVGASGRSRPSHLIFVRRFEPSLRWLK
eukprot:2755948-Amphidinium_carterae.1